MEPETQLRVAGLAALCLGALIMLVVQIEIARLVRPMTHLQPAGFKFLVGLAFVPIFVALWPFSGAIFYESSRKMAMLWSALALISPLPLALWLSFVLKDRKRTMLRTAAWMGSAALAAIVAYRYYFLR